MKKQDFISLVLMTALLFVIIGWYMLFAAISWEFNPLKWERLIFGIYAVCEGASIALAYLIIIDQQKGDDDCEF